MAHMIDPRKMPALRPPPGVMPDFDTPSPWQATNVFTIIFCLSVCTVCLVIQLLTKFFLLNGLKWEDYVTTLAWSLMVPFCGLGLQTVFHDGASKHQWNVNLVQVADFANAANILSVMHALLMLVTKTAVLLQYLRIFVPLRNTRFYLTWLFMALNIAIAFALALSAGLQCIPRLKIWAPSVPGHCLSRGAIFLTSAISNTLADFGTWLLPFCSIWSLQMPWQRKVGVSAIFTVGLFGCAGSTARMVDFIRYYHSKDLTWLLSREYLWALGEVTSGLVCCCLPCLPKLCHHLRTQAKSSFKSTFPRREDSSNDTIGKRISRGKRNPYLGLEETQLSNKGIGRQRFAVSEYDMEPGAQLAGDAGSMKDVYIRKTVTVEQVTHK